jgi:hypothetical protein
MGGPRMQHLERMSTAWRQVCTQDTVAERLRDRNTRFLQRLQQTRAQYPSASVALSSRALHSLQALLEQHAPGHALATAPPSSAAAVVSWARFAHSLLRWAERDPGTGVVSMPEACPGQAPQERFLSRVRVELPLPSCSLSDARLPPVGLPLAALPAFDLRSGDRPMSRLLPWPAPSFAVAGHDWLRDHLQGQAQRPSCEQRGYMHTRDDSKGLPHGECALVDADTASHLVRALQLPPPPDTSFYELSRPPGPPDASHSREQAPPTPSAEASSSMLRDAAAHIAPLGIAGRTLCGAHAAQGMQCPGSMPQQAAAAAYAAVPAWAGVHAEASAASAHEKRSVARQARCSKTAGVRTRLGSASPSHVCQDESGSAQQGLAGDSACTMDAGHAALGGVADVQRGFAAMDLASRALQAQVLDRELFRIFTPRADRPRPASKAADSAV